MRFDQDAVHQQQVNDLRIQVEMDIYEYVHERDSVVGMHVLSFFDPNLPEYEDCSAIITWLEEDEERYKKMLTGHAEWDGCDPCSMIELIDQWLAFLYIASARMKE